ncbi:type III secretion system translocator chaperone SicA [Pectobacterium brasiliense]|uniref:type III secretion system translocator chaperone SicA n=1 Tax=Pectobacterium brasiliense TaxID=180957 RepID=UPI001969011D|nr:type III secretion system translocator chaperone SicA [Pectobacterium brasiliense]MBN3264714.1 type III secretion system translocator chaperone SicA [Pectobacterium brasiliense]
MINENTTNISDDDDEVYDYSIGIIDAIQSGSTLKDVHNVSHETMNDIYKLAYDFYHHGKLNDAESLFRFLCIYDFYNPEYAMGLAAVYQLKGNYPKAIDFYALSYTLSENDYRPMFYAGQCNLMMRYSIQAKKCFEIVIDRCNDPILNEKSQNYLLALNEMSNNEEESSEK